MDLFEAKENIQPLAAGRNISLLQASLRQDSPQELLTQRRQLEDAIHNYEGTDPLEPWYTYICWIEQSCPSGGKESGLMEVLTKCLARFENEKRYYQDRRMIKLYIKFISTYKDPLEAYQQLFNAGIGTMLADFYIAWAYCYDLCGNYQKATEIFRHGIACHAEPLDELQEAHQHFGYSIAQRYMCGTEEAKTEVNKQLEERRFALTSLRGHKKKNTIGSIRTGSVIKSHNPGKVQVNPEASSSKANVKVNVYTDENNDPNLGGPPLQVLSDDNNSPKSSKDPSVSAIRSIIDAARNQENLKEPGPWNKAHDKKQALKLFSKKTAAHGPDFSIHIDEEEKNLKEKFISKPLSEPLVGFENRLEKPFCYPLNFKAKNEPQPEWITPVTTENQPDPGIPQYNKSMVYPRANKEFQLEEVLAYKWFKKNNIENKFTKERDQYLSSFDVNANVRMYPNFAKISKNPPRSAEMDDFYAPPEAEPLMVGYHRIYNLKEKQELSLEELFAQKILERFNKTIIVASDMEETICLTSENIQKRKSFFPNRKSMAPKIFERFDNKQPTVASTVENETSPRQESNAGTLEEVISSQAVKSKEEEKEKSESESEKKVVPFEIFVEEENEASFKLKMKLLLKLPAIPQAPAPAVPGATGAKLLLPKEKNEINDENDPNFLNPPKATPSAFGFFDGEETCSTQTFNIFLKSQSVSTPKALQKLNPQRQFGTILSEVVTGAMAASTAVTNEEGILESPVSEATPTNSESSPMLSPQRKQLSTILETSEHGTTQGTTGSHASTKSTISSSENDEIPTKTQTLRPLETLEEATNESIGTASGNSKTEEFSLNLLQKNPQTPGLARLKDSSKLMEAKSLQHNTNEMKSVGNFTRLEEKEDTALTFGALRPIRFPEEKTETLTKFMMSSRQDLKFPEEKTETLSKIYFPKFEDEKTSSSTGTIPKIPVPLMPANLTLEDSFDIYTKTPPKMAKNFERLQKQDELTPLFGKQAKRFCEIETPIENKAKETQTQTQPQLQAAAPPTFEIFIDDYDEDEIPPSAPHQPLKFSFKNPTLRDSFIPDFSLIEEPKAPKPTLLPSAANKCDSFLPELSFIPESQPNISRKTKKDLSFIPDSQPQASHFSSISKKSLIFVPDSQEMPCPCPLTNFEKVEENSHLTESFMKDFASIKQPALPGGPTISSLSTSSSSKKENVSLKFLNDSIKQMMQNTSPPKDKQTSKSGSSSASSSLKFLNDSMKQLMEVKANHPSSEEKKNLKNLQTSNEKFFEQNVETEMFASNMSMIKNSTWLPNHDPKGRTTQQQQSFKKNSFEEPSLHIKAEQISQNSINLSVELTTEEKTRFKLQKSKEKDLSGGKTLERTPTTLAVPNLEPCFSSQGERSIYYARTPRSPVLRQGSWDDEEIDESSNKEFHHSDVDLDYTIQMFDNLRIDPNVNPFAEDLIKIFLDNTQFVASLEKLSSCHLTGKIKRLHPHDKLQVKNTKFEVLKLVGQGAYGAVYLGKDCKTGRKFAFKQERPPSYWEYYICLEVRKRLRIEELYPAFMHVEYSIVANNSSILISQFSDYGSIINVANKVKKSTNKNIDEYVVMFLTCELLAIFDHLHAIGIIHADVKADNILLMNKLSYPGKSFSLQLIDFGVAIDMKLFKPNQSFNYVHSQEDFKCIEMREQKPWTYQLDLYGLAGIIHVMLFGKYMEVEKRPGSNYWMHKTHVPRYFNKTLWELIFRSLLNIPDCNSMPNLQQLRTSIKEEMLVKEKFVIQMINDFNKALN